MTRKSLLPCLMFAAMGLAGCWPMTRIVWSPDGQRAIVLGQHEDKPCLYLCDGEGRLSPRVAERVTAWAWLADSKRFLVARAGEPLKTWKGVSALMTQERRERIIGRAKDLRNEILKHGSLDGDSTRWKTERFAFMCLRDTYRDELAKKAGEKWKEVEKIEHVPWVVQLYRVQAGGAEPGEVLLRSLDAIFSIGASPDMRAFAYVARITDDRMYGDLPGHDDLSLHLADLRAGAAGVHVADLVSFFFDWSPDSRCLTYARAAAPKPRGSDRLQLGSVNRRRVRDEGGAILKDLPKADPLVGLIFHEMLRVQYLRDGRIAFAAAELKLPATAADMPRRASLFAVDPDRPLTVTRLLPRKAEDRVADRLELFRVSPDGRRVAIPGSRGEVTVLDLTTGGVWDIQERYQSMTKADAPFNLPVWRRGSKELCFVAAPGAPHGSPRRCEIVLWSEKDNEFRCISRAWPKEIMGKDKRPTPQPDSRPSRPSPPTSRPAKLWP